MKPGPYDIELKRGGAYNPSAFVVSDSLGAPINLTGTTALAQIRLTCDSEEVIATFEVTITPLEGKIKLYLSDTVTAQIITLGKTFREKAVMYWDLRLTPPSGDDYYLLEGAVYTTPRTTR